MLVGSSMNSMNPLSCSRSVLNSISYLPVRQVLQAFLSQGEPGVMLYLGGEYPPHVDPADIAGGVSQPGKFTRYKVNLDIKYILSPLMRLASPRINFAGA